MIAADILRSEQSQGDEAPSWLTEKIKRVPESDR